MKGFFKKLFNSPASALHIRTGLWGERQAANELRRKGYRILGKRVGVGKRDELDIVARDQDTLVFVEVKTRKNEDFGRPSEAVGREKKRVLSRAAVEYLSKLRKPPRYIRFDIVEVVGSEGEAEPEVRHLENAFPLDSRYRLPFG